MVEYEQLNEKIQKQAEKAWDIASIGTWLRRITANGIPKKTLDREEIANNKEQILDRVQLRAEECTFLSHI